MIPFYSDITEEDVARTDQIVEFYLGSYDNITEDNKQKMIDIFTDSGCSILIKLSSILSKTGRFKLWDLPSDKWVGQSWVQGLLL